MLSGANKESGKAISYRKDAKDAKNIRKYVRKVISSSSDHRMFINSFDYFANFAPLRFKYSLRNRQKSPHLSGLFLSRRSGKSLSDEP
jgi:hypothetical protein